MRPCRLLLPLPSHRSATTGREAVPTVASVAARIHREGETVVFTKADGTATATVKAFVRGYQADQLVGDIQQGDRVLHVAPADIPWTPDQPDRVGIGSEIAVVQTTETRTLRGVPCMHLIQVRGG
jgi:hypothetical protein